MPAKTITLSQKDQDLLRVTLNHAIAAASSEDSIEGDKIVNRLRELKERIGL